MRPPPGCHAPNTPPSPQTTTQQEQRHALSLDKKDTKSNEGRSSGNKSRSLNNKSERKKKKLASQQEQQEQVDDDLRPNPTSTTTLFGLSVAKFVQCTEESREKDPAVVMRNMRQFMSGMKNYLVRNGEGELQGIIDEERSKVLV